MKKTILKVPVLFVALLFSACGEDLLFDSRGGETTSLAQMETGNTQQEVPVAGEPDTEGTTPDQAIPPA
ncbi:MAG: hypothetical protein LBU21_04545, partial [Treponema sp.]|nr:hypothetical protein [Treponema sp.]